MESDGSGSAVDNKTPTISRLFSAAQTSCLKAYYEAGMRGTGEQFRQLHHKCAEESGLSVVQVMRWIKKKRYNQRHAKRGQKVEVPHVKRVKHTTTWHRHLKSFGSTEAGKKIATKGPASFMKAASESYRSLGPQEKALLHCATEEPTDAGHTGEVKKQAKECFTKIEALFEKLEKLNYRCLAFGFFEDDVQVVTTSDCSSCVSARCLEYLHALTVVANPPPVPSTASDCPATYFHYDT